MPNPRILIASIVKNEAHKFLASALDVWHEIADEVLVVDDASEDETPELVRASGATLVRKDVHLWGDEANARHALWEEAVARTDEGDYIFVLDADMVPAEDPREFLTGEPDALAFVLYDLWSPHAYREDFYWQAHKRHRIWCVRRPSDREWEWPELHIHSGHLPLNLDIESVYHLPEEYGILHYAYSSHALRTTKHAQYASVREHLSGFQQSHARSILDDEPTLHPLPFTPRFKLTQP